MPADSSASSDRSSRRRQRQRRKRRIRRIFRLIFALLILCLGVLFYFREDIPFLNRDDFETTAPETVPEETEPLSTEAPATEAATEPTEEPTTEAPEPAMDFTNITQDSILELLSGAYGPFVISHAVGGLGTDISYSNSLEAFKENYAEGHRIFEADFSYTKDNKIVLWHSWDEQVDPNHSEGETLYYDEFMNSRIYGLYTPMDLADLLHLMQDYPDIIVITDSKQKKTKKVTTQFQKILKTAKKENCTDVLDRIIVQLYNKSMLSTVRKQHDFPAYIFTMYSAYKVPPELPDMEDLLDWCVSKNIPMVTMPVEWFNEEYVAAARERGITLAVHTVNDPTEAQTLWNGGITGMYSDFLPPTTTP